jgi:hypothetical protein
VSTVDVDVRGAVQLRDVARAIRTAERADLRKEMLRALRTATKPLATAIREGIPASVPSGYAAVLLPATRVTTKTKTSGWPAVTVTAMAKGRKDERDLRAVNAGKLRHPVFGRIRRTRRTPGGKSMPWVLQRVPGGFFDRAVEGHADDVRDAIGEALDVIAEQIARS